jgi:hypothetical protein
VAALGYLERSSGLEPRRESLPRCPRCSALLRPHVLLFDELYDEHVDYGFEVRRGAERMALALFVGTSFAVGVTGLVLREALGWRVPVVAHVVSSLVPKCLSLSHLYQKMRPSTLLWREIRARRDSRKELSTRHPCGMLAASGALG